MTTRPTDEEISALIKEARRNSDYDYADALESWLAERQAARDGVTDEMVEHAWKVLDDALNGKIDGQEYAYGDPYPMRAALQSISPPFKSISDALNSLEEWALSGNQLHGDDIQQFRATMERIAPIEQPVKVPDVVYVCSNRDCLAVHEVDPCGHCPACKQENGSGWSTMQRKFYAPQKAK